VVDRLTQSLPALTDVDLSWCNHVGDAALTSITARLTRLTSLDLRRCKSLTDTGIRTLPALPALTTLSLDGCARITARSTEAFARDGWVLTSLDLRDCSGITDQAVRVLVGALPLTSLCLAQCVEITDVVRG
jgi:hypothetical protein